MSENNKIDLRVQRTRSSIKDAFINMICEMDSNQITIKELTDRAKIHRKTFYLHYESIEALYDEMLHDIVQGYFIEINKLTIPVDYAKHTKVFFDYFSKQDTYVEKLICNPSYRDFANKLFLQISIHNRARYNPYSYLSQEGQNIVIAYIISSTIDMYRQWINDKKKLPINEVIDLASKLVCNGMNSILRD